MTEAAIDVRIPVRAAAPHPAVAKIVRFADLDASLGSAWDDLAIAASEPNPYAERWFVTAMLQDNPVRDRLWFVTIYEDPGAGLIGLLPLCVAPRYGRIPVRNVQNWLDYQSFLGTPLVRAGSERAFWAAVLAALDAAPWARGLLHISGLAEEGPALRALAIASGAIGRRCDIVHRTVRAMLQSPLGPHDYYEHTVRKKKRKEIRRQSNRLSEVGLIQTRRLVAADDPGPWCDAFLAMEQAGWKGEAGSALGATARTAASFRAAIIGAQAAGRLDALSLDLDGRPIAMLFNFITPPGAFSFKTAFDETYAAYSPGILIQLENLDILDRADIAWMDSCAAEDHPMINSLWGERRSIVRVSVPLGGAMNGILFSLCRALERGSAWIKARRA